MYSSCKRWPSRQRAVWPVTADLQVLHCQWCASKSRSDARQGWSMCSHPNRFGRSSVNTGSAPCGSGAGGVGSGSGGGARAGAGALKKLVFANVFLAHAVTSLAPVADHFSWFAMPLLFFGRYQGYQGCNPHGCWLCADTPYFFSEVSGVSAQGKKHSKFSP